MYCHTNILNWNDSAGEEAFQNAKKRFWADINSLPCDIFQPDPDLYIDEVNWIPDIDLDLVKDLERNFFCPEGEVDTKARHRNNRTRSFISSPSEVCKGNPGNEARNVWESKDDLNNTVTLKDRVQGWNQWDSNKIISNDSNNDDNPWKPISPHATEVVSAWGNSADMSWGWNQNGKDENWCRDWGNETRWEQQGQGANYVKNEEWGKFGHSFWGNKDQGLEKLNSSNSLRNNVTPSEAITTRGWRNNMGSSWGGKKWNNYGKVHEKMQSREICRGWGTWNNNFHKKEAGHHPYATENKSTSCSKSSWFQCYDNQRDQCCREVKSKKRVSFTFGW